jgi:hypothetical protein
VLLAQRLAHAGQEARHLAARAGIEADAGEALERPGRAGVAGDTGMSMVFSSTVSERRMAARAMRATSASPVRRHTSPRNRAMPSVPE